MDASSPDVEADAGAADAAGVGEDGGQGASDDGGPASSDGGAGPADAGCALRFAGVSSAIAVSARQISLTWSPATDCSTPSSEIVYDICVSTSAGSCAESFASARITSPGASLWNLGNLSPETRYYFAVRARTPTGVADENRVEVSALTKDRRAIVAGLSMHVCELSARGTVRCWGTNESGEIGNGVMGGSRLLPTEVLGLNGAERLAVGWSHSCALLSSGTAACWGGNDYGQSAGDRAEANLLSPVGVTGLEHIVDLAVGVAHTCALLENGTVQCWGNGESGELGDGSRLDQRTPVQVSGIENAVSLSAGESTTCALLEDGTARCWGRNEWGQLGSGSTSPSESTPVGVSGLADAIALQVGWHGCAVLVDGTAKCWGQAGNGQLGAWPVTPSNKSSTPLAVEGLGGIASIAVGAAHTCAVMADQAARCWGEDYFGELGDGGSSWVVLPPVPVSNLTGIVSLAAGRGYTCAIAGDSSTYCWGLNQAGVLGTGGEGDLQREPVPVGCPSGAVECNGRCAFLDSDPINCEVCGHVCALGACFNGICGCPLGMDLCGGACFHLESETQHCGQCGVACLPGETCQAGLCHCDAPKQVCAGTCIALTSDPSNCGSCAFTCAEGAVCAGGQCQTCPAGQALCNSACVGLDSDPSNCGACGQVCDFSKGWLCLRGQCVCPFFPPTHRAVCGDRCVVINGSDPLNCGGCGVTCGAGLACFGDTCQCQGWMSGQRWCGDHCTDLNTDSANCGYCGHACALPQVCEGGACQ